MAPSTQNQRHRRGLATSPRWLVFLLGGWFLLRVAADPSFTATLEPDSVAAGDAATLKLIFTDLGEVPAPTLPTLTNCAVQYQGAGSQISIVNFSKSSSIIHQFALQPKKPGIVSIPALSVEVAGKTYSSQPLILRVGQGFDLSTVGYLRLVVPRREVYVGETFPLEIRFYYQKMPDRQVPPTLKLDGFIKGRQTVENLPAETITNVVYSVVRWSMALTAVKAGELTLGPAEFQTLYSFPPQGRRQRRGMEALFEPLFGGAEQRQLTFTSDELKLNVLNPPIAGRPATFNGAVGRFGLSVTASPTNVAAGDPVTVRVKISGQGNFDSLRLPELPRDSGFQLYPGTNSFAEGDPLGLTGVRTFEAVIVPEQPGLQKLNWPALTFWDPNAKAFATDQPQPLSIFVRPGASAQAQPAGTIPGPAEPRTVTDSPARPGELALLQDLGPRIPLTTSYVTRPWFWGLWGLPLFMYAALALGPAVRKWRTEDPELAAKARARRTVVSLVAELGELARKSDAIGFFASLNSALQQQLALTVGGLAGSFTEEVVETRLIPAGLGPEDAARLRGLFGRIAEARFAPTAAAGELEYWREQAEIAIQALRRMKEDA